MSRADRPRCFVAGSGSLRHTIGGRVNPRAQVVGGIDTPSDPCATARPYSLPIRAVRMGNP
jgi:hypothetical protein